MSPTSSTTHRRRGRAGIDIAGTLSLVGVLGKYLGAASLFPALVALIYSEPVWPFLAAGAITSGAGWALDKATGDISSVGVREGFLVVALTWLWAASYGALTYLLADVPQLSNPFDAYFEAMSGFTTTGATVLTDIDALPRSVAMWRQFTQWLGGIGIIVLSLAVLPRLRIGGRQLLESELPGPEMSQLASRIRDTARRFWLLYLGLTVTEALVLVLLGVTGVDPAMDVFNAVAHALTTIPTGGFSPEPGSIGTFGAEVQWVILAFMLLGGVNFALLYRAIVRRRPVAAARDEEFRLYLGLVAVASVILLAEVISEGVGRGGEAIRTSLFQATSLLTTTGYATTDYTTWPTLSLITIVGLMFVGASAGSTSGSVKVLRHVLLGKILRRELDQTVHPELMLPVRFNKTVVDERTLRAVSGFILLYIGLFILGAVALGIDAAIEGPTLEPLEVIAAAAASLGNVGPALGFAGPLGSYEPFSDVSKTIMIALMWLGRLEVIPVVVLLTRNYWRA
jgi:trk system potassium uptake protein TrkH